MQVHKTCNLCGTGSEDTAVFTCSYAKGDLNICLGCLAEGILETMNQNHKPKVHQNTHNKTQVDPMLFDLSIPDEVYGFSCEKCGTIMFSDTFPAQCDSCEHVNQHEVLQKNK